MKKIFSALLTVCMLLGCLSACGSKNPSTSDDGSATTGAKDTIVFAQASDITSLDFHVGKNPATYDVTCNIFDTLSKKRIFFFCWLFFNQQKGSGTKGERT